MISAKTFGDRSIALSISGTPSRVIQDFDSQVASTGAR